MALGPKDLQASYDQQKVDEIIFEFDTKLKFENKDQKYYHVVITREYSRILLDRVEKAYKEAGWKQVKCKTSSENFERPGLTGLQLWL